MILLEECTLAPFKVLYFLLMFFGSSQRPERAQVSPPVGFGIFFPRVEAIFSRL